MGGGYSDLIIYFRSKRDIKYGSGYSVTPTQKIFEGCSDFQVITHNITFPSANGLEYNVLLYDGSSDSDKGSYVFGYYYPKNDNEVIETVSIYYSVLAPNDPLVISFKTKTNTYNCSFEKLISAEWDRAYNIDIYSLGNQLTKDILDDEFTKRSRKRKILFKTGSNKTDISGDKQELGNKKSFRFIFTPKGDFSVLGSDYLFAIDFNKKEPITSGDPDPQYPRECKRVLLFSECKKKGKQDRECNNISSNFVDKHRSLKIKHQNQIDPYYLQLFNGKHYDGIMVYFERDKEKESGPRCRLHQDNNNDALLIEFIDSSKSKAWIKRMDKVGCWWAEEQVPYKGDKDLSQTLARIKSNLEEVVTVILDKKSMYKGIANFVHDVNEKTCLKYTHKFEKANKPNLVFGRKKITFGSLKLDAVVTKDVDVYYLRPKNAQNDDKEPFLIVFNGDRIPSTIKAYHFAKEYGFEKWTEFKFEFKQPQPEKHERDTDKELKIKLEEKVDKIKNYGSCIGDFNLLRAYAYDILTDPEITITEPKKPPPKTRPPVITPKKETPLPIQWIIAGSVGGGVFVISSAALYGVYWYNTTIKLLT